MPNRSVAITERWLRMGPDTFIMFQHPGAYDRAVNGQMPLLADHSSKLVDTLGHIDRMYAQDRRTLMEWDFYSFDSEALRVARGLYDEGHKGLSVGLIYRVPPTEVEPGRFVSRPGEWEPIETSMVSTPRDDRTEHLGIAPYIINQETGVVTRLSWATEHEVNTMPDEPITTNTPAAPPAPTGVAADVVNAINQGFAQLAETLRPPEPQTLTASSDPSAERRRILDAARGQSGYDSDQLLGAYLEAETAQQDPATFAEKLQSIRVITDPTDPVRNDSAPPAWDLGHELRALVLGEPSTSAGASESREILGRTKAPVAGGRGNTLAIPTRVLAEAGLKVAAGQATPDDRPPPRTHLGLMYGRSGIVMDADADVANITTTADASAGDAIGSNIPLLYNSDVDEVPVIQGAMMRLMPMAGGDYVVAAVNVPNPEMAAEPATGGYAFDNDITADDVTLKPKIVKGYYEMSRLANVQRPALAEAGLDIAIQKARIVQQMQVLDGDGQNNNLTGVYSAADVGSSDALTALSGISATVVDAALASSWTYPDDQKLVFTSPEVRRQLRTLARVNGVSAFLTGDTIDGGARVVQTKAFGEKTIRGVAGPWMEAGLAEWDDSVFVTIETRGGTHTLLVELFWNYVIFHAGQFHRFRQD